MSKVKLAALLVASALLLTGCSSATLSDAANSTTSNKPKLTPQESAAYRTILLYQIPNNHETVKDFLLKLGNDVHDTVYMSPYTFGNTVVVQFRFGQDFDIDFAYQNGKVEPADQASQALLQGNVGEAFTDAMDAYESAQQASDDGGGFFPIFIPMEIGRGGGGRSYSSYSGAGRVSSSSGRSSSSAAADDDDD